jgi:hypothetical protein
MSAPAPQRPARVITRRTVSWSTIAGVVMLGLLVGIAWRATNVLWFLLFPVLVLGSLVGASLAVLWALRHF